MGLCSLRNQSRRSVVSAEPFAAPRPSTHPVRRPASRPHPAAYRRLPAETVYSIVGEAVDLEREFCCDALSVALVGMNAELMAKVWRGTAAGPT